MKNWKFDLGNGVRLSMSNEKGVVIGRAEYSENSDQYLVRYKAADGRQTECWWGGEALCAD